MSDGDAVDDSMEVIEGLLFDLARYTGQPSTVITIGGEARKVIGDARLKRFADQHGITILDSDYEVLYDPALAGEHR